jgi:hypothetical protein
MYVVKVLKRKDASSVVVAILLALMVSQMLMMVTNDLTTWLSGLKGEEGFGYGSFSGDWKVMYLQPLVSVIVQLVALEVLIRLIVMVRSAVVRKK